MARLEDITRGASVKGILPGCNVTVVDVRWHGTSVLEVTYKYPAGRLGELKEHREALIADFADSTVDYKIAELLVFGREPS